MATELKQLPPFTGKTFDDLLADVQQRIEEEPTRLDMRTWVIMRDGERLPDVFATPRATPACGTVACLGGWMAIRTKRDLFWRGLQDSTIEVGEISGSEWGDLFTPYIYRDAGDFDDESVGITDADYVPLVLARLAKFRADHKVSLQTPLPEAL